MNYGDKKAPTPHSDSGEKAYQKSFWTTENKTLLCVPQVWTEIRPWSRAKKSTEQNQPSRFPWPLFSRLIIGLNKVSSLDQRHWHLKVFPEPIILCKIHELLDSNTLVTCKYFVSWTALLEAELFWSEQMTLGIEEKKETKSVGLDDFPCWWGCYKCKYNKQLQ